MPRTRRVAPRTGKVKTHKVADRAEKPSEAVSRKKASTHDEIKIPASLSVKEFADLVGVSPIDIIKQLMRKGIMANINQIIDRDTAAAVAKEYGREVSEDKGRGLLAKAKKPDQFQEDPGALKPRPPVVTIMGHVDHGKTKLLDAIRQSNVVATEAGEITQHIGAYQVEVHGHKVTFLDTPGHEAFTAMRAHGAQVTDIAVLVVAADDGVMPQTIEAISHAKAAGVPIVVALNKIDKPEANVQQVKQQLADNGVLIEEWGGQVVCVPVSAKAKEGIEVLLENLIIVAELEELKANPDRHAIGVVVESRLDKTKGPVATVLIQTGTLKVGDPFIVGDTWGKVKAMLNDKGKHLRKGEPSSPVEILGLENVPSVGDTLTVKSSEREARDLAQRRQVEKRRAAATPVPLSLSSLSSQIRQGGIKELNVVLKTDVRGSIEPIKTSLEQLNTEEVKVHILHADSGTITESDVLLGLASRGIILGFNTRPEPGAAQLADTEGIDIRTYQVIYGLIDDVEKAMKGMLEPTYVDVVEGRVDVRAVFPARGGKVAGSYVTEGKVTRGAQARIIRQNEVIFESKISSLKRFKEDVREATAGLECGIGIEGFTDFEVGDVIEAYKKEMV